MCGHDLNHELLYRHPVEGRSSICGEEAIWGFNSIKQLRQWFDYFGQFGYDTLTDNGYHIGVYEVPDKYLRQYTVQVTFNKCKAAFVEDLPMPSMES